MPIHAKTNLYPGINPHLNSALQQPGGEWVSFHNYHLIHLADFLDNTLPEAYYAKPEKSLQLSVDVAAGKPQQTRGDIVILRDPARPTEGGGVASASPSAPTMTFTRLLEEEEERVAVMIYRGDKPVTRIELLSPSNKYPGSHYPSYRVRRDETLAAGLNLIEMDYLHVQRPVSPQIASYADREPGAYPYHIIVNHRIATAPDITVSVYSFGVMDTLPVIVLPLDGDDTVTVDFGALYHQTFSKRPFRLAVDYTQEPVNFDAYTEADQQAIRAHMKRIAQEQGEKS